MRKIEGVSISIPSGRRLLSFRLTLGLVGHKVVDLGGGTVVGTDLEALVSHVEDH